MNSQYFCDDSFPVGPSRPRPGNYTREETRLFELLQRYPANPPPTYWRMTVLVPPPYILRRATAEHSTPNLEPSASASIQSSVSAEDI